MPEHGARELTPGQTVGPFFHDALPYERDNQLVPPGSAGAIRLRGTVYDGHGAPVPDALLEIRQADPTGQVPQVEGSLARDGAFTGWGRTATDPAGGFLFTTFEPGPTTSGRAAYIGVIVFARGLLDRLFTRIYVPGNGIDADPFLSTLTPQQRASLIAERSPDGLSFNIHLQGEHETAFLEFPGQEWP